MRRQRSEMRREDGFTLIELLITMALLSAVSVGFYSVMFAGTESSRDTRSVARISEEARLGLNRIIRDTREAQAFRTISLPMDTTWGAAESPAPGPQAFRIWVDFNADRSFLAYPSTTLAGDYEDLTYSYHPESQTIRLNGEVLIGGVTPIPGQDMFSYSSHRLEYDLNPVDGVVTPAELQAAQASGAFLLSPIWENYSDVRFAFNITNGGQTTPFTSEVQMRNRRGAATDLEVGQT